MPRQPLVQVVQRHGDRTGRRPLVAEGPCHAAGFAGREHALDVLGPDRVRIAVGPGVHPQFTVSVPVGGADGGLDLHRALLGQHERRLQHELPHHWRTDLVSGVEGELHPDRAGDHDGVEHRVVGQPGHRVRRPSSGPEVAVGGSEVHFRAEQRVPGARQAGAGQVAGVAAGGQPVPLALERVRGQIHVRVWDAFEDRVPVHFHTDGEQFGGRGQQAPQTAVVTAQRPDHRDVVQRLLDRRQQHRMRTDLHERPATRIRRRTHRLSEPHRRPQIVEPVPGIHPPAVNQPTGHRREHRDLTRTRPHQLQISQQPVPHLLHLRRMRRIVHRHPPRPHPHRLTPAQQQRQTLIRTRHHHRGGSVHRRHRQPLRQQLPHPLLGGHHRHHPATTGKLAQRPAAQRHHPRPISQRQDPGHTRRRDLTLRVTDHRRRPHPPRTPHLRQRHHHRPQHRLHHINPRQIPVQRLRQRPLHKRRQRRRALGHRGREHRRLGHQLPRHPGPLRALTREHPHHTTVTTPTHRHHRGQRLDQLVTATTDHHRAMLKHRTRTHQRRTNRHSIGIRRARPPRQTPHLSPQALRRLRRNHPRNGRQSRHRFVPDRVSRRLLQHDVGVRAADPERRHRRTPRLTTVRPRSRRGGQPHRAGGPVDVRRRLIHVQRRRHHPMPHRQDHLDHTSDTGRRLRVADIRLHRTQQHRPLPALPIGGQQRLRLNRITQPGPRPVRLHHINVTQRQARIGHRLPNHPLLRRTIRRRQTIRRTILIHRTTPQHSQNLMTVTPRIRQPLQQHQTDALAPPHPVGRGCERLAPAVRRQSALTGGNHVRSGRRHHRDAAGDRQRAVPAPQGVRGEVHGDQ